MVKNNLMTKREYFLLSLVYKVNNLMLYFCFVYFVVVFLGFGGGGWGWGWEGGGYCLLVFLWFFFRYCGIFIVRGELMFVAFVGNACPRIYITMKVYTHLFV